MSAGTPIASLDERVLRAAVECIADKGVARTTLDDVARAAGCGRATIYRLFPGGRDAVMVAAGQAELAHFLQGVRASLAAGDTLEDCLVAAVSAAARNLAGHRALQHLLAHEPAVVLPLIAFEGFDPLLATASAVARAELGRFVEPELAAHIGEWAARLIVSYAVDDTTAVDLGDPEAARWFIGTFLLPGLQSASSTADAPGAAGPPSRGAPRAPTDLPAPDFESDQALAASTSQE